MNWLLKKKYDLYILLVPDIEWVDDGLRDSPTNRMAMHMLFKNYLVTNNRKFIEIGGTYEQRFFQALKAVSKLLYD